MKIKFLIVVCVCFFVGFAHGQNLIQVSTDHVSLIYRVDKNGRLYQIYLGQKLEHQADFSHFYAHFYGEMIELTLLQIAKNDEGVLEAVKEMIEILV
jgi:DUF1009 family protein